MKGCRLSPAAAVDSSWLSREGALLLEDETLSAERRAELRANGQIGTAEWDAAFGSLGRAELDRTHELIASAQADLRAIDAFCTERFQGEEGPHLYPLQALLEQMLEFLVARGAAQGAAAPEPAVEEQLVSQAPTAAAPAPASGPIANRQDALKRLREIGEFFKRSEPHSPLSLLIARAVRWGDMTFEELVKDLARNADLKQIWETLGVGAGDGKEK